jgi:hypothetical protein
MIRVGAPDGIVHGGTRALPHTGAFVCMCVPVRAFLAPSALQHLHISLKMFAYEAELRWWCNAREGEGGRKLCEARLPNHPHM